MVSTDITEITEVEQGEEIELKIKAADEWDSQEDLRFTWDLDLTRDTNGDGDATNDADYTGSTLAISFDDVGKARFAIVYDQSNNTDFEILRFKSKEPPSEAGLIAIVAIISQLSLLFQELFVWIQGIQRRHAVDY